MKERRFVSYLRVSTERQGVSGLGLDAQRQSIENYLNGGDWEILEEFVEHESGRSKDRPKLIQALESCKRTGSTLVIAKLDRLARNVLFVSNLMESGVDFLAVDFPYANKLTIHILAAVAEHEAEMISVRTKDALAQAKKRGVKLGTPENLTKDAAEKGRILGNQTIANLANEFTKMIYPIISNYRSEGLSYRQIASRLESSGIKTSRGGDNWSTASARNILKRFDLIEEKAKIN